MKKKWFITTKKADFNGIAKKFHIDPVIARVIRNRDILEDEEIYKYLKGGWECISSPKRMYGVKEAVKLLQQQMDRKNKIRIISDYDVDGVISNYILWKALHDLGATIDFRVPHRITDGYGINEHLIREAKEDGISCIITCDNGIAAKEAIALGKELGLVIIVTDHHEVPYDMIDDQRVEILPPADVIIDPKQKKCLYPFKELCGAGVAFQLMRALYQEMEEEKDIFEELLPFLAIATVCDVVSLTGENRIFVKEGLKRMKSSHNVGLQSLIQLYNLKDKKIDSYHLGFMIGPCINASGRLESAQKAVSLFIEEDEEKAFQDAKELIELNEKRKDMTKEGTLKGIELIEKNQYDNDSVMVVYLPDCHESIAGIIAGRIKERYHRPVFVLTDAEDGVKGSGRSIEQFHMFEAMIAIKDVFTKFGGHAMAAGCSLKKDRIDEFRKRINENCQLTEDDFIEKVKIDVAMPVDYVTEDLIQQLSMLEPFGMGNRKPLFAHRNLLVEEIRVLGKNRNAIRLNLKTQNGAKVQGIIFEDEEIFRENSQGMEKRITCTYQPEINEYNGYRNIQMKIQDYFFTE